MRLPGCDIKFSQKNFKEKLYKEPELYKTFVTTCYQYLSNILLQEYYRIKEEEQRLSSTTSVYDAILDQLYNPN